MAMLTIIVPVYNEHDSAPVLLENMATSIQTAFSVVMVYDSEGDSTIPAVKGMMDKLPFKVELVRNMFGKGALNAIKTGLNSAHGDALLVTMADNSDDLHDVDSMYQKFLQGYDVVCGSRYVQGGQQIGGPRLKKFLSRLAGVSLHWLIGIPTHDVTNSFKMYSRKLIESVVPLESEGGFEIGMELTVKAYRRGFQVTEVPTKWTDRANGQSNFHLWSWLPKYISWYIYALYRHRRDRFVQELGDTKGETVG